MYCIIKKIFLTKQGLGNADINEVTGVPAKIEV